VGSKRVKGEKKNTVLWSNGGGKKVLPSYGSLQKGKEKEEGKTNISKIDPGSWERCVIG